MRPLAASLLMLATASAAFSQHSDSKIPRSILKISPQYLFDYSMKVGIERFNIDYSKSIVFFATGKVEVSRQQFTRDGYSGMAGEFQYRKYISPMKHYDSKIEKYNRGVHWSAFLQGGHYNGEFKDHYASLNQTTGIWTTGYNYNFKESISNGAIGFTIGFQRSTLWEMIYVDAYVGGGLQTSCRKRSGEFPPYDLAEGGINHPDHQGILAKVGINLGIGL